MIVNATGTSAADAFDIGQHYLAEDVQEIVLSDVPETEKARLIRTRLGQGAFRSNLLKIWRNACAVTGCQINAVLRASHIKPWRDCENNNERLDPDNGLILSANLDTLFDRGLISFSDTGQMLIARNVSELDRKSLGLGKTLTIRPSQRQKLYLRYHREKYGFG